LFFYRSQECSMICECYYNDDVGLWKSNTFGISLMFVFIFLCVDVDNVDARAKQKNNENKKWLFGEAKYYSALCVTRTSMLSLFLFCVVVTLMGKMPECEFYWTCASISKIYVTHDNW